MEKDETEKFTWDYSNCYEYTEQMSLQLRHSSSFVLNALLQVSYLNYLFFQTVPAPAATSSPPSQ